MKPILFNTEMVCATLDDRKKVTRRVVNYKHLRGLENLTAEKIQRACVAPYNVGDILYVRETWASHGSGYYYRADADERGGGAYYLEHRAGMTYESGVRWRPSIHMPHEAARIFLRVTGVRVERLQELDADGIRSEGLTSACVHAGDMEIAAQEFANLWDSTIKPADHDRYGWAANPWVWVIEFERCEKPEVTG